MEWVWVLIPLAGISVGIVAIVTEHRQKMAMIEKGLLPENLKPSSPSRPEDVFRGGTITLAIGVAFLLAQLVGQLSPWLFIPAFVLLFVGGALMLTALFTRRSSSQPKSGS